MKKKYPKDPFASREAANYANPIASREHILELLRESVGPLTLDELAHELQITEDEAREALRRRLAAMARDGQVASNRRGGYGTLDKMSLVKGRVIGHPEGYGFVSVVDGDDIFLSSRQMRRIFHGDEVLARISGWDRRGRPEGSIVEVVNHCTSKLVGRFFLEAGVNLLRPDNPRISQDIIIPPEAAGGAQTGQMVLVEITRQPSRDLPPMGRVVQVLGEQRAPGMEILLSLHNYNIPHEWDEDVISETDLLPEGVLEEDKLHRIDLRPLDLVTIDGEDAKDFDDAVYCEPLGRGGWRLIVAIADVSHYVAPGSALDREAWNRGTSVYFPGQVVPMLPEKLSNGLCSLRPEVDRLCLACEMVVDEEGATRRFHFFEAVMHSRARLTYTQVAGLIAQRGDAQSTMRQQFRHIVERIDHLYDLYRCLRRSREERGAIDFETGETRILFDAERKIEQIIPEVRTEAHKLIEECMLAANVCAAQLLEKSKLPALYRVHMGPTQEKLESLREFLAEIGIGLAGGDSPTPMDYQKVLEQVADRPDAHVVQAVMLRSMSRAEYCEENEGHFGLNYPAYTHFTSPIRRYPDLITHRALRALLQSNKRLDGLRKTSGQTSIPLNLSYPYDASWMATTGVQASYTERRADEATRDVETWLKCEYLLDKIGEEYSGVVTSVVGFGLFVELTDLYVEGLIHITGLPKDYYYHEPAHHRLVGERSRRIFRLGDTLRVRVSRVDLEERKVDFELVEESSVRRGRPLAAGRKQKPGADGQRASTGEARKPRKRAKVSGESSAKGTSQPSRKKGSQPNKKKIGSGSTKAKSKVKSTPATSGRPPKLKKKR